MGQWNFHSNMYTHHTAINGIEIISYKENTLYTVTRSIVLRRYAVKYAESYDIPNLWIDSMMYASMCSGCVCVCVYVATYAACKSFKFIQKKLLLLPVYLCL